MLGRLVLGGGGGPGPGEKQVVVVVQHRERHVRPPGQARPPAVQVVEDGHLIVASALQEQQRLGQRRRRGHRVVAPLVQPVRGRHPERKLAGRRVQGQARAVDQRGLPGHGAGRGRLDRIGFRGQCGQVAELPDRGPGHRLRPAGHDDQPRHRRFGRGHPGGHGAALAVPEHEDPVPVKVRVLPQQCDRGHRVGHVLVSLGEPGIAGHLLAVHVGDLVVAQYGQPPRGQPPGQVLERLVLADGLVPVVGAGPGQQHHRRVRPRGPRQAQCPRHRPRPRAHGDIVLGERRWVGVARRLPRLDRRDGRCLGPRRDLQPGQPAVRHRRRQRERPVLGRDRHPHHHRSPPPAASLTGAPADTIAPSPPVLAAQAARSPSAGTSPRKDGANQPVICSNFPARASPSTLTASCSAASSVPMPAR